MQSEFLSNGGHLTGTINGLGSSLAFAGICQLGYTALSGGAIVKTAKSKQVEAGGLNRYPVVTLEFTLRTTSGEHYAETDFVHSIGGRIMIDGENNAEANAGFLSATLVQFDEAMDFGVTPDRLGDGLDGGISEYWECLFDPAEGRLKEVIQDEHEPLGCNLLIIDCVELWPKFRGRGVAKSAIERTIAIFGAGCGLVACKPWPLQFTSAVARDPRLLKRLHAPEVGREAAVSRLRKFWSELGFRPVRDTDVFVRSTALKSPGFANMRV